MTLGGDYEPLQFSYLARRLGLAVAQMLGYFRPSVWNYQMFSTHSPYLVMANGRHSKYVCVRMLKRRGTATVFALSGLSPATCRGSSSMFLSSNPYMGATLMVTSPSHGANLLHWSGTPGCTPSYCYLHGLSSHLKWTLNTDTYSLVTPVASGLNASNIGALQSYYSFSSASGIGSIYGTDLTSNMSLINYSVSGSTAFLTWRNNGTAQGYLTNLVLYGQAAETPAIGIDQTYSDANSIQAYGLNPSSSGQIIEISNSYVPDVLQAQSLCEYLVGNFSTPFLRHTVDNFVVPPLQFGDCITLVNQDTGESRICFIMGITNKFDKNAKFSQQLILQERQLDNYFTIGVSTIGGPATIAP